MIEYITTHFADIFAILTALVAAASAIANITPTDTDNKFVAAFTKFIDYLALNFKKKA